MTYGFLSKVVLLVLLSVSGVWAQFDMAECKPGREWNRNSLGQDPCLVGSMMDASCRGLVLYNYPPLNASQYYLPPRKDHSGDLTCDCNTVMYNLYMACASCQDGQTYPWASWITACEAVYVSQYPVNIAQGTAVPHWAYFNITTLSNQTYDEANAIRVGRDPEQFPPPVTTSSTATSKTKTTSRTNTRTSTGLPGPTGDSNDDSGGKTKVGAIVGGVVGSVVPLTFLGVGVFFYLRHRRQKEAEKRIRNPDGVDPYQSQRPSMYGPPVNPYTPYNPSDPSTFPPQTQSQQNSVTYTTPSNNNIRGAYSGIPEV